MLQRYLYEIENYNNPFIPDLKEAIILTSKALRQVKKSTVVNCWIHSGIVVYKESPVAECVVKENNFVRQNLKTFFDKFKSNEDLSFDQYLASDDNLVDCCHHISVKSDQLDVIDKLETIIMDLINFNLNQKTIEDFMQRK